MSASVTGVPSALRQRRTPLCAKVSASAPASRTTPNKSSAPAAWPVPLFSAATGAGAQPCASEITLDPAHGHRLDEAGRRVGAAAELEIVGGRQIAEHLVEIAGDGDLADRIGELAVLDPEAGGAAAIIAGDGCDAA